jgi:hypothetical protein
MPLTCVGAGCGGEASIATGFVTSPDAAKRNPGTMMRLARPLAHSAALHAG